jgi:hybrid cluster-associated redox disulfide protein
MVPVDPTQTVSDVLRQRPGAARVFLRRRMACPGCAMAPFETLEEVARVYRVPLEPFLRELEEADDVHRDVPAG